MISFRDWTPANLAALAALVVALLGAGITTVRAHAAGAVAEPARVARVELPARLAPAEPTADSVRRVVDAVVEIDPFQPDRTAPLRRFRDRDVPDERATPESEASVVAQAAAPGTVRLQGIVRLPNGGALAVLSMNGGAAKLVRVGQTIDQYRLTHVDARTATLAGPDTTLVLRLPNASPGTTP